MLVNTICLLVKGDPIESVLLARKKRGFGEGKIVAAGGTVEADETVVQAAAREIQEELSVTIELEDLERAARIEFYFPGKPEWNRVVFVYLARKWAGEPVESDEVNPQ
ncbi:MAG: NUDIX domain-containing protein, partial [Anaerolineales bacterium]|nr:NUDIX domain-containing protein [Anaerolineales bacterium]